jgi:hypothetical protein
MRSTPNCEDCPHDEGWEYDLDGERWVAWVDEAIHREAQAIWCPICGELWFRFRGGWYQLFWTAEEIEQIQRDAAELGKRLGFDDRGDGGREDEEGD